MLHRTGRLSRGNTRFLIQATVISINRKTLGLIALIVVILAAGAWAGYTIIHANTPVRIGVLLPVTGDIEIKEPLEWAKDNINREGGIGGRQIELVYKDTGSGNVTLLARELLDDPTVHIVIGPPTSDQVYALAPEFIAGEKLLISPETTSGDIIRAFGRKGYFWRTCGGDVAQVNMILSILKGKGAKKVALLVENTTWGETFYAWTGFFSTEYGLELTSIRQFDPGSSSLDRDVADALKTNPDYIIAICRPPDATTIKRAIDRSGSPAKLFLADASVSPVLTNSPGAGAEGLEGTSPTADPSTGFVVAYQEKFGHPPTDYAAPAYDALLLAAYTTARQDASPLESPADSVRKVVYGNGTPQGWDAQESHEALSAIRAGETPAISGASGPLDYDTEFGVDPLRTYYSHWIVEDGDFRTVEVLDSAKTGVESEAGESVTRFQASKSYMSSTSSGPDTCVSLVTKKDFRAVVVGPSSGWINYRHQADALTVYTLLRQNGIPDDHIILMTYDDVPTAPENPLRGDLHNIPKGKNIRSGAEVDYSGSQVTAATLKNVLTGTKTASTPIVLESNASTDVFVYIASHGAPGGIAFWSNDLFTRDDFNDVTNSMNRNQQYRQIVFVVDTCFGESVAMNATAPGILYLTGAAYNEPSLGAVYDMDIKQWLSDEFTSRVIGILQSNRDITFRELYAAAYDKVTGSHVRMITTGNVSIDQPVREYLKP
ncbi:C13 family peptidase [uncultured Methanoregula sp.]|uniref:C13 family peptidase n=1 Tax=uncultured Methanoregula sp. TaxID=1005933 RepID=UPI002AAC466E|nr:C13 family peptidase [uncultured Methanoregula sp.]